MKIVILENDILIKYNGILVQEGGEVPISFTNVQEHALYKFAVYFNNVRQELTADNTALTHVNHLHDSNGYVTIKVEITNQATGAMQVIEKSIQTKKYIGFGTLTDPTYETPLAILMKDFEEYKLSNAIQINELKQRIKKLEEEGDLL